MSSSPEPKIGVVVSPVVDNKYTMSSSPMSLMDLVVLFGAAGDKVEI